LYNQAIARLFERFTWVNEANASKNSEQLTLAADATWPELNERGMATLSQKVRPALLAVADNRARLTLEYATRDTRHTTHDTRHTTHDTRHATHDTRHTTHDTRHTTQRQTGVTGGSLVGCG
jgi:hypothetical protein